MMRNNQFEINQVEEAQYTEIVKLELNESTAQKLSLAAAREGMTESELVTHMVRDYVAHVGIWL